MYQFIFCLLKHAILIFNEYIFLTKIITGTENKKECNEARQNNHMNPAAFLHAILNLSHQDRQFPFYRLDCILFFFRWAGFYINDNAETENLMYLPITYVQRHIS